MDKLSYALGVLLGENLKQQGLEKIEGTDFLNAFETTLSGGKVEIDVIAANQMVQEYFTSAASKSNSEAGTVFLAQNATKSGVTTLASGMQYEVMTEGDGPKPKATDNVTTHYHGTLIDGTVFDSSVDRGEPATFPVNGVIAGWIEALQLMNTGSKWRLFIPAALAYGDSGTGQQIGPGTTLIFEVELLSIA